jgi:predicted house-cleaning noncanonical NTP pyrophosphatase (MazG superfamily)
MNQVATTQQNPMDEISRQIMEVESTHKMCQMLLKTPHYAKMGQEGIFAIISKARSLGMDAIEALNGGLYYVQGKVGMPAESMAALIRQKGHSVTKDPKSTNEVCILHGKRGDNGDTWIISFSMDDAKRAGLAKNMYEKYPGTMLYNRAMSFLARQLFPDVIRGAGYTFDELKEIASNQLFSTPKEEKIVELVVESITKEQAEELKDIFDGCDPAYCAQVMSHLKKADPNVETIENIPSNLYERIKNAATKKRKDYQDSLNVEDESFEVVNA